MKLKNSIKLESNDYWSTGSLPTKISRSLRSWLEEELEVFGIDYMVYGRYIVSLLLDNEYDGEINPKEDIFNILKSAATNTINFTELRDFVDRLNLKVDVASKLEDAEQSDSGISGPDGCSSDDDEQYFSAFPPLPFKNIESGSKNDKSCENWLNNSNRPLCHKDKEDEKIKRPPFIVARLTDGNIREDTIVTRNTPFFLSTNSNSSTTKSAPENKQLTGFSSVSFCGHGDGDDNKLGLKNLQDLIINDYVVEAGVKSMVDFVLDECDNIPDSHDLMTSNSNFSKPLYQVNDFLGNFSHSGVWSLASETSEDGWRPINASWLKTSINSAFSSFKRENNFNEKRFERMKPDDSTPLNMETEDDIFKETAITPFKPITELDNGRISVNSLQEEYFLEDKDDDSLSKIAKPGHQFFHYSGYEFAPQFKLFDDCDKSSQTEAPLSSPADSMELGVEACNLKWSTAVGSISKRMEVGNGFLHNYVEPTWANNNSNKKPCQYVLSHRNGECKRSDCKFEHNLKKIVCRYWLTECCFKGVFCPFRHSFEFNEKKMDE